MRAQDSRLVEVGFGDSLIIFVQSKGYKGMADDWAVLRFGNM